MTEPVEEDLVRITWEQEQERKAWLERLRVEAESLAAKALEPPPPPPGPLTAPPDEV